MLPARDDQGPVPFICCLTGSQVSNKKRQSLHMIREVHGRGCVRARPGGEYRPVENLMQPVLDLPRGGSRTGSSRQTTDVQCAHDEQPAWLTTGQARSAQCILHYDGSPANFTLASCPQAQTPNYPILHFMLLYLLLHSLFTGLA
jgi:hypothetical protein